MKTKVMGTKEYQREQIKQCPIWLLKNILGIFFRFDDTKSFPLALDDALEAVIS